MNLIKPAFLVNTGAEGETGSILVNLSGRGDRDIDFVVEKYGADYGVANTL